MGNILIVTGLIYAFAAGFRTVHDYDIGWQLATGRWVIQHHQVPSTDVFSYTAHGKPWIYPPLSAVVFYVLYLVGGYPALTWLTAVASASTIFFLTRQRGIGTAAIGITAVPIIINRLTPRADLFSTVLFAALLGILWAFHCKGKGSLWVIPLLMFLWVNLHWGFVAGLGLCGAYLAFEAAELAFAQRRAAAKERLHKAWPWLLASGLATLLNPWGPSLYRAVLTWSNDLATGVSSRTVATITTEYLPFRLNASTLQLALDWRRPDTSAVLWILIVACVAIPLSVAKRRLGPAILLAGAAGAGLEFYRFQGMFACVAVVLGGAILDDSVSALIASAGKAARIRWQVAAAALCICVMGLAGIRCLDLISNRYYLNKTPFVFGTGLSWWYPERAMEFVERERLPGNVFNGFELGGFLIWRLPQYPDFIDTRGRPFDGEVMHADSYLPAENPDSSMWQQAADKWGVQSMIVPAGRIDGLEYFPKLWEFCESQTWRPVYLDEVSVVFLRQSAETKPLIDRLAIDCKTTRFNPPIVDSSSGRGRGDLFNFWANTGFLLTDLNRPREALEALDTAQALFPDSAMVHAERGELLLKLGKTQEAETELRRSTELDPENGPWEDLATLIWIDRRYDEATAVLRKGAELTPEPARLYFKLGEAYASRRQPRDALSALDEAARLSAWVDDSTAIGAEFHAKIAETRARIWSGLGDPGRAVEFEEQAVHLTPEVAHRWGDLATLYQALGRTSDARRAMSHVAQ